LKHLKALNKYFWKYRVRLGIGALFIIISNYFAVLVPQVTSFIIDFVQHSINYTQNIKNGQVNKVAHREFDYLVVRFIDWVEKNFSKNTDVPKAVIFCGVTILLLALLRGFFMFLMRQTIIVMSRHIEYDQKNEVFQHYQKLDTAFYKTHSTGDLMSRMAEDVARVRMFTGPSIMYLINLVALISLSLFFMIKKDPELTAYVLAPLPVLAITIYYVNSIINKRSERIQALLASLTTNAQESYSGIRVIKSYVQEKAMLGFFDQNSEEYKKNAIGLAKVESLYFPTMALLIGLSTLLTIMIGGYYFIYSPGRISLGTITEFVIYINMLTFPVSAIGWTASMIQRAAASQKRLNEFLQSEPEIINNPDAKYIKLEGNIRFRHVDFIYPHTGIRALKDFDLTIKKGEKIAIIGRTGSGKSTVAQLLLRMYDVTQGSVELDGVDIRQIELTALRKQISYVPQDVFLFSDTVAGNISFGVNENSKTPVEQAAQQASVHHDISGFEKKYETQIGERGVTLSGGQKQRISIARALMKDPGLVIFDDCLSAVDTRTEREIIGNLYEYLEDKTAIIITHRVFSLFHFDKIVVIEDGEIIEEGTHLELLQLNGYYTDLYLRQQRLETRPENNGDRNP
jgi:ATP-binding cassette subfamily B protein